MQRDATASGEPGELTPQQERVLVALAVLKGLGLLGGYMPSVKGDDPGVLREEAELSRNEAEMQRRLRALTSLS